MRKFFCLVAAFAALTSFAQTSVFNYGSSWKYLDNGSNQGTAWRSLFFDDQAWSAGNAELGYGDGDEATRNKAQILKLSADLGHYIADAHVPLHATSNYNGQKTGQRGIHGFWESRIPELLAESDWDFLISKAQYIKDPAAFIWARVRESAAAADTVLKTEAELSLRYPTSRKFAFEERNGIVIRQYASGFTVAYDRMLNGMTERRMRSSIFAIASFWYTAWVDAGQPDLPSSTPAFTAADQQEFDNLETAWRVLPIKGREH